MLSSGDDFTPEALGRLQNDYLSLPARTLIPYLMNLTFEEDEKVIEALEYLKDWDYILDKNSIAAGIYVMWEREIREMMDEKMLRPMVHDYVGSVQMTLVVRWIEQPELIFHQNPIAERDAFLKTAFEKAVGRLSRKLGSDLSAWKYGQERYKHAYLEHPLSTAVNKNWQEKLNLGPLPRGGYSYTPAANGYHDNNTSGASFRIIVDTEDWEKTLGINNPGQSGDPNSRYYDNLFEKWANDEYFIVPFDKVNVEAMSDYKLILLPLE